MWSWDGHMGWGWMWMGWLIFLLLIAAAWFATSAARRSGGPREETPEQVLKRRYAKGEIDRETYQRMLEDLRR